MRTLVIITLVMAFTASVQARVKENIKQRGTNVYKESERNQKDVKKGKVRDTRNESRRRPR